MRDPTTAGLEVLGDLTAAPRPRRRILPRRPPRESTTAHPLPRAPHLAHA